MVEPHHRDRSLCNLLKKIFLVSPPATSPWLLGMRSELVDLRYLRSQAPLHNLRLSGELNSQTSLFCELREISLNSARCKMLLPLERPRSPGGQQELPHKLALKPRRSRNGPAQWRPRCYFFSPFPTSIITFSPGSRLDHCFW